VPANVITNVVQCLPTDNIDVDRDIVIAACRNRAADHVSAVVTDQVLKRLALEVVATQGVDAKMKISVVDRCNCCLQGGDDRLMCSALRCLAGIGELWRTPPSVIHRILTGNRCRELCNCCYPAIVALAREGKLDPDLAGSAANDIAAVLIARASAGDTLAGTALVGGCQDIKFGFQVLNMVESANELPPEVVVRVLLILARCGGPDVARNMAEEWDSEKFIAWHTEFPGVTDVLKRAAGISTERASDRG
jgi:hypothetical protein